MAGIEPTLQRPKRRVIPFHYTEILVWESKLTNLIRIKLSDAE